MPPSPAAAPTALHSAEGWYPEQKLTMAEAWEGYTLGPAYAAYMEDRLGRLAPITWLT